MMKVGDKVEKMTENEKRMIAHLEQCAAAGQIWDGQHPAEMAVWMALAGSPDPALRAEANRLSKLDGEGVARRRWADKTVADVVRIAQAKYNDFEYPTEEEAKYAVAAQASAAYPDRADFRELAITAKAEMEAMLANCQAIMASKKMTPEEEAKMKADCAALRAADKIRDRGYVEDEDDQLFYSIN